MTHVFPKFRNHGFVHNFDKNKDILKKYFKALTVLYMMCYNIRLDAPFGYHPRLDDIELDFMLDDCRRA